LLLERLPLFAVVAVAAAVAMPAGCATTDTKSNASYADSAHENYDKGLKELQSENWADAVRYFHYVRAKFGFSKWATLSELGIADADVGREKYQEAIDGYKAFIKNHPTHPKVQDGYAAYRIGEAFYKQIPGDFFLFPPSHEKDQGPVRDAQRELTAFLEEYSDSTYVAEARKRLVDCERRLAEHELYVANFYLGRNKPQAAVGRLEGLLKTYPHSTIEPEVLLLLGKTHLKLDHPVEARRTFERLAISFPGDYHAKQAKLYLEHIAQRYGARAQSEAAPPVAGGGAQQ
jgi:outer membrane protein assembly factor BamD